MNTYVLKTKKIFCNTCKYETNHDEKSNHDRLCEEFLEEGYRYYENFNYLFLVCRGCDTATIEESYNCSGMHDYNGNDVYSLTYFPPRNNSISREIKKFLHIDKKLNDTYKEIIAAYRQGLGIVTAMGVRALLEGICVAEGVNDNRARGLSQKIEVLKSEAKVPESIIDGLKGITFIGNDAAHRLAVAEKYVLGL